MPLNCSIFVTQKEQLKCQAARGTSLIRELNKKGDGAKVVTIKTTDGGNYTQAETDEAFTKGGKNGKGSNSEVFFNPDKTKGGVDVEGKRERPTQIAIGHELIHAESNTKGASDLTKDKEKTDPDTGDKGTLTKDEILTRKKENVLRKEQGVTERATPK